MRMAGQFLRYRWQAVLLLLLLAAPLCTGCATVKPYDMEFLTDPIMLFEEINPDVGSLEFLVFGDMEKAWVTGGGGSGGGCVSCAGK
ncbi:MAG: hypothetical protein JW941_05880 [Candidatus Coatesbacteria bacterium]|nr:hypothetical protein [Candidatus Coatesbacteria bacterium]